MTGFTYVVLRYVHDSAAGESLNVGVLLVAPNHEYVACRLERHPGRLSAAFRDFDASVHRHAMRGLAKKVEGVRIRGLHGQRSLFPLEDAGRLIRTLWPDVGLSYRASEIRAGTADDPERALNALFDRFVASQEPNRRPRSRRDDADVWRAVQKRLPTSVAMRLRPARVVAGPFTFQFDHAYQNGELHVIEPLSFDLLEADTVRDKSMRWVGYALHLKPYLGTLNLVVDGPLRSEMQDAYRSALKILRESVNVYELDQTNLLENELGRIIG